jgi:hypothetical protein
MKRKVYKTALAASVCAAVLIGALFTACDNGLLENTASGQSGQAKNRGVQATHTIRTAADMAKIGVDIDWSLSDDYILDNDITLTAWTPIGTNTAPFTGTFDGDGNTITITGFSSVALAGSDYLGIFGYVGDPTALTPASITNLTIVSAISDSTERLREQEVGALVGHAINATIEDITLEGSLSYTSVNRDVYAGGIAGFLDEGVVFSYCTGSDVTLTITGGGGANSALVPGQYNTFVGGLAGLFRNGVQIENCHYTGDISAAVVSSEAFAGPIAGGITGGTGLDFAKDKPSDGYIADSSFSGTISASAASGSYTGVGGIAGTLQGGDNTPENASRAIRCKAEGTLSNADTGTGYPFIGGIVGYNYMGGWVDQCYFDGTITSAKMGPAGGIAGYNTNYSGKISGVQNCHVGGNIGTANAIGGIDENGAVVFACYITATFTGSLDKGCLQPTGYEDQTYYESEGFDFTKVWKMPSTPTPHYPLLQWE